MKYAVVRIRGQQHKVSEGDEILIDRLGKDKPVAEVLLLVDGKSVKVGKPIVKSSKIGLKIINQEEKGKKLMVSKFKAKSRYRRKMGFRPVYTRLKVGKISS